MNGFDAKPDDQLAASFLQRSSQILNALDEEFGSVMPSLRELVMVSAFVVI